MQRPDAPAATRLPQTLRTYAEQLPTVLSVPNLKQTLREAADEIDTAYAELTQAHTNIDQLLGELKRLGR